MTVMAVSAEREERRRVQKEIADELKASGALDEVFARIGESGGNYQLATKG